MTTLVAFVLLLSVLIFVHELGHFAVAKACGVRVLKFSLGFGPPIGFGRLRLRWVRNHTEYVVACIPLGGFVKMLGENPDEEEGPEARANPEESLAAKPLWQKLAIVFAGPVMNLLLPVVIFVGMQAAGLPREVSVIGLVEPGSPAAAAGLRPGDRITAIGGEPVQWWSQVAGAIEKSPGAALEVDYQRGGQAEHAQLALSQRSGVDDFGETAELGWAGLGHARPAALLGIADPDAPAARAGLRSGDRVTAVGGKAVADWYGLESAYAAAGGSGRVDLAVERPSGSGKETHVEVPALGDLARLGVVRATALVSDVEPGSPADRAGLRAGDLILGYDGTPVTSFSSFAQAVSTSQGHPLHLLLGRDGEHVELTVAAESIPTDTGFGIEEPRYRIGIRGAEALVPGVVATDRERNPLVSLPRAVGMTVDFTHAFLVGLVKMATGQVSSRSLAGPIGIAQIAGTALEQGWDQYLRIMVLISINLGILNLLPIPVLDGGQALVFLVEGTRRTPLSLRTKLAVQQVGITVLVLLMGLAFWNDLSRLWSKVVAWLPGRF